MSGCELVWVGVGGCDCPKHISGLVYLSKIHLSVGVGVFESLKHIYG